MLIVLDTVARKELAIAALKKTPTNAGMCMEIKPYKTSRSLEQNRRYWAIIKDIADQYPALTGEDYYTPDVWHLFFRKKFLGYEVVNLPDMEVDRIKSTTGLKVKEFADYMTQVEVFGVELGVMFKDVNYG